ncbi:hypothetical protein TgHK011_006548 [Trichoderma gracile]|nr:hypothetical protein TgHK011_006548 [Trichoderma gracile]
MRRSPDCPGRRASTAQYCVKALPTSARHLRAACAGRPCKGQQHVLRARRVSVGAQAMGKQIDQARGSCRGEARRSIAGSWRSGQAVGDSSAFGLWLVRMATSTSCKSRSSVQQTGIAVPFARGGRDPKSTLISPSLAAGT